jgi:hypothetical protein
MSQPRRQKGDRVPRLTDLDVEWVSLVDRAAVRDPVNQAEPMRFLVWKRENPDQGAHMTPEEQTAALKKAQDDLAAITAERDTATAALAKSMADLKALQDAEDEKNGKAKKGEELVDKSDLPAPVRAALEKAEADNKAMAERLQKAEDATKAADDLAKAERDTRLTREFVTKAEGYRALVLKAETFGPVLKEASEKLSKESFDAIDTVLKAADAAIAQTDLFKEQGRSRESANGSASAAAEVTKRAEELRKSDSKLTVGDAMSEVFKADTDLQARYLAEVRR